ncbi:MAG: phosphoesterase PA-phosphatase-like protein [Candidatus Berkelbacteria bacterium Licking1014_2]|uniref:Phosphoesterase PA-phosphatase-like protein n=1 Tax=Candidatus Berkelbacteria bacterium Licking1014_2 TaxID=2017146 RepID=A0A554LUC8_9BACT|nr:MAG: phosphoesterase PA-phosphatase-like protein [Candidatus Berkelbacteria bacterium Licking1014_2]
MDEKISHFLVNLYGQNDFLNYLIKFLAINLIYAAPVILIILFCYPASEAGKQKSRRDSVIAAILGLISWQVIGRLVAMIWTRERPFVIWPEKEVLFHRPDYSFPSDHAAFLTTLIVFFYLAGYRKLSYWLAGGAILILLARVIGGIHWPSDILAGIIIGAAVGWLGYKISQKVKVKRQNHKAKFKIS